MTAPALSRSKALPALYPLLALVVGALLLPSALRPPPEQTSDSAALNPNAPPDENQEQIVLSQRQASGGAGQAQSEQLTTTTTEPPRLPAGSLCIGNPPRQIESIYSAPCAPRFIGNNGGVTGHNVFPNEVRWGFWHTLGAPPAGPVDDEANPTQAAKRTFKHLQDYFNKHFEFYGRKVRFYGMSGNTEAAQNQAIARKADQEYRLFGANHLDKQFCVTFARNGGPVFCQPEATEVYEQNRPNFYSFMIDRTLAAGFGAEYACKKLIGLPARHSGTEQGKTRKISIVTEFGDSGGLEPHVYENALKKECGATYGGKSYQLKGGNDSGAATTAVLQMQSAGVTTVVLETNVINLLYLMTAAEASGWQPEWVIINSYGLDFNTIGTVMPANQSKHLFGLSGWEVPRRFEETECYQAYKEMDADGEADATTCQLFWHTMVLAMSGIQNAGPRLDAKSFEQGLLRLGHRFPVEPWGIGGGFGPADRSYMDNLGEIWFSLAAQNPENGAPGAYVWTYGATRWKRGEIPDDEGAQLFKHGVTTPGGPDEGV